MIDSNKLEQVRTIHETDSGSAISTSIQEKDPNTLFPLQAALRYDVAQNLYISSKNLLVEGVSDLIYLEIMSGLLEEAGRHSLDKSISIVPVGGMEKVATFIFLMRGSKLSSVCLLDTNLDSKSKSNLENLIKQKIIKGKNIVFYDKFTNSNEADVEDLFTKKEYLSLYNLAFTADIKSDHLNEKIIRIILQINKHIDKSRFNHYIPANYLAIHRDKIDLSDETLSRFETLFQYVNDLLSKEFY